MERTFDRIVPPDWEHYERYPLRALPRRPPRYAPVVWGINWYSAFDRPEKVGTKWWVARGGVDLGSVRGGHAIASPPELAEDSTGWWDFYDQGAEGACVGYAVSRAATWLNRQRYDARWLYGEAKKIDYWEGEDYEGTSVRAGLDVLVSQGHRRVYYRRTLDVDPVDGIASYWWASSVDEILSHFGAYAERVGAIPFCNSWGRSYPHTIWMPAEAAARVLAEDGEVGVLVDL